MDGFELVPVVKGSCTLSVSRFGVQFGKYSIEKLGFPEYIQLYVDKEGKLLKIVPCLKDDKEARKFVRVERNPQPNFLRLGNVYLTRLIENMMCFDTSTGGGLKCCGEYLTDEKSLLFDLKRSIEIDSRSSDDEDEEEES